MDAREERRLVLSRRVSTLLRDDEQFRAFVCLTAPDGTRPIVVAMIDDKVGELFAHIDRHHPGGANVLVGIEAGHFVNLVTRPTNVENEEFGTVDTDCPVHIDSEVGMLVAYVLLHKGERVRCRPIESYAVDLVEEPVGT